jgi:cell division protein FtsB
LINIINNYEQELVDIIDKIPARGQKLEKEINLLKAKLFAITEAIEKLEKSSF